MNILSKFEAVEAKAAQRISKEDQTFCTAQQAAL